MTIRKKDLLQNILQLFLQIQWSIRLRKALTKMRKTTKMILKTILNLMKLQMRTKMLELRATANKTIKILKTKTQTQMPLKWKKPTKI